jgi:hypothetical protein
MPTLIRTTPVLRIFDEAKAREFYIGFLGFQADFEHRFGDGFPLYMSVSSGGCVLHLSEHHGDACPGSAVRIESDDVAGLCAELSGRDYRYAKPGSPAAMPWGTLEITITDPFGNRLTFHQPRG